jgi:hypothetical protein
VGALNSPVFLSISEPITKYGFGFFATPVEGAVYDETGTWAVTAP